MQKIKQTIYLVLLLVFIVARYLPKAEGQFVSFIPDGGRCRANRDCCRPVSNYRPGFGYFGGGYHGPSYTECRRYCSRVGSGYGFGVCVSDSEVYCKYNKQDRKRCNLFPGGRPGYPNPGYRPTLFNNLDKLDDQLEKFDDELDKFEGQLVKLDSKLTPATVPTTTTNAVGPGARSINLDGNSHYDKRMMMRDDISDT